MLCIMIINIKCLKFAFFKFSFFAVKSKNGHFKMSNSIFFNFRLKKIKKSLFEIFYFYYAKWSQSEKCPFMGG